MRSFICVTWMLATAVNVLAQGIRVVVLSPTANEEFYLGEKLFFDYVSIDSNIKQLNIFMESFGKTNTKDAIKLVADISKSPNGTFTTNNHTYNKYSLYYTIPAGLPIENESYQVSFETSEGDIVIPIKIKAPTPAMTASTQVSTSVVAHVTEIILPTITTTIANNATIVHTASPLNMNTSSALLNSVTSMMGTATHASATATVTPAASSSQTPVSSLSNISTSSSALPLSSSFSATLSLSLNPSSTSSASWAGLFSASLVASTTPIPPDPESFMQSSAARNYMQNSEFSFIAATLLALLLVRLLLV
ncbi:hypothetical protein MAM1_0071d04168 [Mucor ambiguus]|uniref:Uncharacterized protein n=1 Tax=Mucor ambiguus TaxID=91626 RepID=A0A0C9MBM3_9FUNG|nr:hypothetical protein MAM1_0071d04168 [Mucor ambiguus]